MLSSYASDKKIHLVSKAICHQNQKLLSPNLLTTCDGLSCNFQEISFMVSGCKIGVNWLERSIIGVLLYLGSELVTNQNNFQHISCILTKYILYSYLYRMSKYTLLTCPKYTKIIENNLIILEYSQIIIQIKYK